MKLSSVPDATKRFHSSHRRENQRPFLPAQDDIILERGILEEGRTVIDSPTAKTLLHGGTLKRLVRRSDCMT